MKELKISTRPGKYFLGLYFPLPLLFLISLLMILYSAPLAPAQEPKEAAAPPKVEDFYPLHPDNFWTYQVDVEELVEVDAPGKSLFFWRGATKKTKIQKYQTSYTLRVLEVDNRVTHKVVKLEKKWHSARRPWGEPDSEITYQIKGTEITQKMSEATEVRYRFPIFVGARWGDPQYLERADLSYFYSTEKQEDVEVPAGKFPECFWIIYRTRPDHTIEWFYPGVGVVKREYHHHGTLLNIVESLVKYKVK